MSAISSAGSGTDLTQLLQSLQNSTANSATSLSSLFDPTDPSSADPTEAANGQKTGHHHHHHGISNKIESAVATALQSSDNSQDPNQVVKDAIAGVLGSGNTSNPTASQSGANGANGTNAASGSSLTPAAFTQLLQSYGINAQQFQQDLQSAVSGSQGDGSSSNVDFAALFKSFPPGSAIEATG